MIPDTERYARWEGRLRRRILPGLPIARMAIRQLLRKRAVVFFLITSFIPAVVYAAIVYFRFANLIAEVATLVPAGSGPAGGTPLLHLARVHTTTFLYVQSWFVLIMTSLAGAGLISRDLLTHALDIYLTKPLRRRDYLVAKGLVVALFIGFITVVPALVLFVVTATLLDGFLSEALPVLPPLFLACLLTMTVNACVILALSSVARSARYATAMWFVLYFFTFALSQVLRQVSRAPEFEYLNYRAAFDILNHAFLGLEPRSTGHPEVCDPLIAGAVLGAFVVASIALLAAKVRSGEGRR